MRIIDILICLILIPILLPVMVIIAIILKIDSPGPVIHYSKRFGQDSILFKMPKFRTMHVNTPQLATHLIDSKSYITKFGKFLRKTSLDEIPQIFSVLLGDMSLVGPRPALFNQDDLIELRTKYGIHRLRPGITGWAQINGRDELSIVEKVEYEIYYNKNRSIMLDVIILIKTVAAVVLKKNIKE